MMAKATSAVLLVLGLLLATSNAWAKAESFVVASKKFPESALLAELLAQGLEARGIQVERRTHLGNTAVAFAALKQGSIDVYPEYNGTALGLLDLDRARTEPSAVTPLVRRELLARHGLHWGPALGFDNSYAIAVTAEFARKHKLATLSGLAELSRQRPLQAAFTHEFLAREDGYRPLAQTYGLELETRATEHGVAYQLLEAGRVEVIDAYATEGLITRYGLVVLTDDREFFPPYQASFLYGAKLASSAAALAALNELSGLLDAKRMRSLNALIEVDGVPVSSVARAFREHWLGGASAAPANAERRKQMGFFAMLVHDRKSLLGHLARHLELTLLAMLACVAFGIPLGYLANKRPLTATLSLGLTGALQTVPSLALLVLVIPLVALVLTPLGQGGLVLEAAALLALFAYSLLPVVRNTKQGLGGIDPAVLEAARGTGMTERQLLVWVQLPLALPVILAGVRTAFVITVGTATLAAFVGAGGLGVPILSGLSVQNFTEVWTGAVPAALLALGSDAAFALIQHKVNRSILGSRR